MKKDGCAPGLKTYDLLMGKLVAHNRVDKANALYKEAKSNGLAVEPKAYMVQPRYAKKKPAAVKEKKRETLPEKMARKRRRLKKLRLSYVKKPKIYVPSILILTFFYEFFEGAFQVVADRLARGKKDFGKNVPCDVSCFDKIWIRFGSLSPDRRIVRSSGKNPLPAALMPVLTAMDCEILRQESVTSGTNAGVNSNSI